MKKLFTLIDAIKLTVLGIIGMLSLSIPSISKAETEHPEASSFSYIYIFRNDTMPYVFGDGAEWKITFSNFDTLGVHYREPVTFCIQGGKYQDSTIISIEDVKRMQMYEATPVTRENVFVITKEHFEYILDADSASVTFSADVANELSMPFLGDRVVCHIFKDPLMAGLVGIVTAITVEGDKLIMTYVDDTEHITEYYSTFQHEYSITDFFTKEERMELFNLDEDGFPADLNSSNSSPRRQLRKGDGSSVGGEGEWFPEDEDGDFKRDEDGSIIAYNKQFFHFNTEGTTFVDTLGVKFELKFDKGSSVESYFRVNLQIDGFDSWTGVKFVYVGNLLNPKIEGSFDYEKRIPIPRFSVKSKKNDKLEFVAGLYARIKLHADVTIKFPSFKSHFYIGIQGTEPFEDHEKPTFVDVDPDEFFGASWEGEVGLDVGCYAKVKDKKIPIQGEFEVRATALFLYAKRILASSLTYDTPEKLARNYDFIRENNEYAIGTELYADFRKLSCPKLNIKDRSDNPKPDFQWRTYWVSWTPQIIDCDKSYVEGFKTVDGSPKSTALCRIFDGPLDYWHRGEDNISRWAIFFMGMDYEIWAWHPEFEAFSYETPIGRFGGVSKNFKGGLYSIDLPKGMMFDLYVPFESGGTYGAAKDIGSSGLVPFYIGTKEPDVYFGRVTAKAKIDEYALDEDVQAFHKFKWGWQYCREYEDIEKDGIIDFGGKVEEENCSCLFEQNLIPETNYKYRVWLQQDDWEDPSDYSWGEVVHFNSGPDKNRPMTKKATDVSYSTAMLNAEVHQFLYEDYVTRFGGGVSSDYVGFRLTSADEPERIFWATGILEDKTFSVEATQLRPQTLYTVRAFVKRDGVIYDGYPEVTFTTKDPFRADILDAEPKYWDAKVSCTVNPWLVEHFHDPEYDIKFNLYIWPASRERTADDFVQITELTEGNTYTYEAKDLEPCTEYNTCIILDYKSLKASEPYESAIFKFTTLDPFEVITKSATELSDEHYSIVLNGKMSDYLQSFINSETASITASFEYSFEEKFPNNPYSQIYTSYADINESKGTFSFNTDYTRNDFLIGLGDTFYYRAVVEYKGKKYHGHVLKAQIPDIFYVGESDHREYDDYVCVKFKIAPEVAYLGMLYDKGVLGDSIARHSVIPFVDYALTEEGLYDEDIVQSTSGTFNENGMTTTYIYDMEYNSTYYYRCGLKVDNITIWGDEIKSLETLEWDPDHGVDAPRRRPTHGQQSRKRNLSQVSE